MRISGANTRISGPGFIPFSNWRLADVEVGTRRRPISEPVAAPAAYTPKGMMVA